MEASGWEELLQKTGSVRFFVYHRANQKRSEPKDREFRVHPCAVHTFSVPLPWQGAWAGLPAGHGGGVVPEEGDKAQRLGTCVSGSKPQAGQRQPGNWLLEFSVFPKTPVPCLITTQNSSP